MSYNDAIDKYINEELTHLKNNSKTVRKSYLKNFFLNIDYKTDFNEQDVINFFNSDYFMSKSVPTKNFFKITLKSFTKWKGIKISSNLFKKCKEINRVMKKSDLLTKGEIKLILKNLNRPIEKAIFMLLLESRCRKAELIELKIGDIAFYDSYAMVYIRKSKTSQRNIPIVESIPYLMRYLEDHPFREEP
ncbi:MAG: tyrosine-type recombinase/integrase, partial [Candidatus Hodarchaeota archaeon]